MSGFQVTVSGDIALTEIMRGHTMRVRAEDHGRFSLQFGDCRPIELEKVLILIKVLIINFCYCFC